MVEPDVVDTQVKVGPGDFFAIYNSGFFFGEVEGEVAICVGSDGFFAFKTIERETKGQFGICSFGYAIALKSGTLNDYRNVTVGYFW